MRSFLREALKPLINQTKDKAPAKITSDHQESAIQVEKKDISGMTVRLEERDNFDFTYEKDWEITGKTKIVSGWTRQKNVELRKNELRPYFAENIKNNVYIMFQYEHHFMLQTINLLYDTLNLYHKLLQNY